MESSFVPICSIISNFVLTNPARSACRLWICWDQAYGMFGITIPTRGYLHLFFIINLYHLYLTLSIISNLVFYRMSVEMVACIGIEGISILEKMHSKG